MRSLLLLALVLSSKTWALQVPAKLPKPYLNELALADDLKLILKKASMREDGIKFRINNSPENSVSIHCSKGDFHLDINAAPGERAATFYKGLREIGFLFPHPRTQISPSIEQMKKSCEKTFLWRPTLKMRGLHLHTLHPSEWVHGFMMNSPKVAEDTVRWLARNGQNILDVSLLRIPLADIKRKMSPSFYLAQSLEIHTGVSIGTAVQQQKTYKLLTIFEAITGWGAEAKITSGIHDLLKALPLSFIVLEAGTSEFTPANYQKTISGLNLAAKIMAEEKKALFTKIHVSSNQHHEKWGNYNFLPQYTKGNVGIWPHTVMFYGLLDEQAPMYGNKNFFDMRRFMEQEKSKRPTWYYPETGYWIGMDQDIPLLLTDYLRTRAQDMEWLKKEDFEGQANFTTGHALGGWLWDWNLALMTDQDYNFNPLTGLTLLGEDFELWKKHLDFQKLWFKDKGLIRYLSAANLQDELSSHRIHDRYIMKELVQDVNETKHEIDILERGYKEWPAIEGVKNEELKLLLEVTKLRHAHAIAIRKAIISDKEQNIKTAQTYRLEAQRKIELISQMETNYPDLPLFKKHTNPTSYQFGYAYLAGSTYFWDREERQIRDDRFFPFTKNIIDVWNILF